MAKKLTQIIDESVKTFYNAITRPMPMSEFIDLEVNDRENYTANEVNQWMKKYGIKKTTKVIWVCPKRKDAIRYMEFYEDAYKDDPRAAEADLHIYTSNQGFIIPESNDDEGGFLFVLKK